MHTRRQFNRRGLASFLAAGVGLSIPSAGAQGAGGKKLGFAVMGLGGFWDKTISQELPHMENVELRRWLPETRRARERRPMLWKSTSKNHSVVATATK